jgi:hypothetical protein
MIYSFTLCGFLNVIGVSVFYNESPRFLGIHREDNEAQTVKLH